MTLSFKNVGIRTDSIPQSVLTKNQAVTPIGIKTPLELDTFGKEIFKMNYNIKDQIKDNLKNLLTTNYGERVFLYDFGANLKPLVADYTSKDDFDSEAMIRINTAISKWMSFVTPLEFDSTPYLESGDNHTRRVKITIIYSVPNLGISNDIIELLLAVF